MISILARYTVKSGQELAAENIVRQFIRQVHANEPDTRYSAWRIRDAADFLHLMTFGSEAAHAAHRAAPYTMKLVADLYPLCVSEPVFDPLYAVDNSA